MKLMISGHRIEKLQRYDIEWIKNEIDCLVYLEQDFSGLSYGMSGMASGVDLWFCSSCIDHRIPYSACIPFDEQSIFMDENWAKERERCIRGAANILKVRNNYMVEKCDKAIVVWDGNKGGTHNCFQQLLEYKKQILWIEPIRKKVIEI